MDHRWRGVSVCDCWDRPLICRCSLDLALGQAGRLTIFLDCSPRRALFSSVFFLVLVCPRANLFACADATTVQIQSTPCLYVFSHRCGSVTSFKTSLLSRRAVLIWLVFNLDNFCRVPHKKLSAKGRAHYILPVSGSVVCLKPCLGTIHSPTECVVLTYRNHAFLDLLIWNKYRRLFYFDLFGWKPTCKLFDAQKHMQILHTVNQQQI